MSYFKNLIGSLQYKIVDDICICS